MPNCGAKIRAIQKKQRKENLWKGNKKESLATPRNQLH
jgi:hypothetical protein